MDSIKNLISRIFLLSILILSSNAFSQVVINEVMAKPSGGNTSQEFQSMYNSNSSYGHEWVELYNTDPCTPVDISCWTLGGMDGGTNGGGFSFPNGTIIPPLGFLVIGGPNAPNVDFNLNDPAYNPGSGWLWTSAANRWHLPNGDGWLSLYNATGNSVDAVYWTFSANDPGKISTDGTYDGTPQQAPNCGTSVLASAEAIFNGGGMEYITFATSTGQTFARDQDGSMNWIIDTPTPKACNGTCVVSNPFTIDYTMVPEACLGDNNGSITVDNINGGSGTFSYAWTPGGAGTSISGLSPGSYNLIITDDITGCQFDTTFILPAGPNCAGCPNPWSYNTNTTPNTVCNGTMTTCTYTGPSLLINEVHVKPSPDALAQNIQSLKKCTEPTYGSEFIELYNPNPCDPIDISCYIIATSSWSTSTNGSFRFPAGTTIPPLGFISIGGPNSGATFDMFAYCGDPHQQTGNDRWYLDNGDYYVALYDDNGTPLNAVYWTSNAGEAAKWGTDSDLDDPPQHIPAGVGCPGVASLAGPGTLPAGIVEYAGGSPATGNSLSRSVDGGGTWVAQGPTVNNCNAACATPSTGGSSSCDGTATATPINGTAPYSYQWDANANSQTTQTAIDLCAGTYCVTITDNAGCDTTICITVIDDFTPVTNTLNEAICTGQSYTLNGTTYTTTGVYTETFIGGASNGCDSIVTLNLTVDPVINVTDNINACQNSTVTYPDGTTATITANTSYTSNLTSVAGCDSIIVTNVTMDPVFNITENINACENSTVTYPDGTTATITANTSYTSNLTSVAGCDSIIVTNVTMDAIYNITENINACENSTVTYPDGTTATITANTSYTSNLTSVAGCDSIIVTNVTMDPVYNITENINACENSTVTYPDGTTATITANTSYTSNLTSVAGCDSIIVTNVTMDPVYNITENINACENSTVTYPDGTTATITANTSYTSNLTSVAGCDSIIVTNVTMDAVYNITENINACENSTITYPDGTTATITANTSYTSNLTSVAGCDSIIVTNVTMDPVYNITENINACENSTVTYPDGTTATITANTSYTSNLTTTAGCDSIIVTNVTMDPVYNITENINACENSIVTYPDGTSATITASTSYTSNLTTTAGCDSIIVTNVTMDPVYNITENINACENSTVTYPDGTTATITTNISYTSNLTSVAGCDSIIVTNVIMDPVYNITEDINACENSTVTYPDGTTATITASTSYTSNLTTTTGCDSIIVTNVTMDPIFAASENVTVCTGADYTYPDGTVSTNITVNESHVSNLTSVAGCDSVITTNVAVNSAFTSTEIFNICEGTDYTYPDGTVSTNIITNESHVSTFVSVLGCDSIVTTNLTVDPIYNITENINACENSTVTYPDGTTATITANTSYTSNLTSVAGCDSIIVTNVTMDAVYNITENINACENSTITYPDGTTALITASTSYTSNLTSSAGCDSIIVTNVTMDPIYTVTESHSVCSGADYTYPDGTTSTNITVSETHISNLTTVAGCDSIITTNVAVNSAFTSTENFNICEGTDYTYPDGTVSTNIITNESHVSTFVSVLGCDSIVTTNLTVDPIYNITENINACENSTVTYPDGTTATITANTSYTSNLTTVAGCDSIIVTNVTMDPVYNITENINACENSTVTYPDGTTATITANISYTSNLTSVAGCDSIIVTNVTMDAIYNITENINACENSTVTYPDGTTATITANTSYTSNLTTVAGCDSIIVTNVTMDPVYNITENINACENSTVTYPDGTTAIITANTSYTSNLTSTAGCDSIIVTNVTMDAIYNITENINACENSMLTYPDGTTATITANTSYTSNLTSVAGCDSIIVTNVIMDPVYNITENINACENSTVTYPDGTTATITANTSYTSNLTSVAGCDSIIVTNVTMDPIYSITLQASICSGEDFTFPDGTTHTGITADQTYTSIFTSFNGCDSILITQLTVNPLPTVIAGPDQTVCEGQSIMLNASGALTYSWDNGVTNGVSFTPSAPSLTYSVIGTDANGCVSTDQVTVNVNPVPNVAFYADVTSGCTPLEVTFINQTTPGGTNCTWELGDGTTMTGCDSITHVYYTSGTYDISLTVTSVDGCTANAFYTNYITVVDPPEAIISAHAYFVDINDPEVQFYNSSINADSYYWDFDDGNSSFDEEPSHTFPEIGNTSYNVTMVASNSHGCVDTANITINVEDILIYYVPNVFTPDGDQFNETFQPVFTSGYDPYDFHLMIFNRWGELIFESYNADIGWDGTYGDGGLVQDGVYVWKINFKETMSDKKYEVYGHVTVLK